MRRTLSLAICLVLFSALAVAQDSSAEEEIERDVFAPFVSRLRVAVRDPEVRLTWRDSADLAAGTYQIYRHTTEISAATIDDATLVGDVAPGTETFLDTPPEEGRYFYAILAAEPDGRTYPIFVPFRNKTLRSVEITRLESEEDLAARVYDIDAIAQDGAVILVFEPSRTDRNLAVYRSTAPFSAPEDITRASLLAEIPSSSRRYADYPVPGVSYFYAVVDTTLVELGSPQFENGENFLTNPVGLALAQELPAVTIRVPNATKRRAPLPILQVANGIQTGANLFTSDIPRGGAQPVSATTQAAIDRLLDRAPDSQRFSPEPVILPGERGGGGEGVTVTLSQIATGEFAAGSYRTAVDLLKNILDLPLSPELERRVRFYLGQSLYLDGRREPAFMEFILAAESSELYSATRPWIDGILSGTGRP